MQKERSAEIPLLNMLDRRFPESIHSITIDNGQCTSSHASLPSQSSKHNPQINQIGQCRNYTDPFDESKVRHPQSHLSVQGSRSSQQTLKHFLGETKSLALEYNIRLEANSQQLLIAQAFPSSCRFATGVPSTLLH